MRQRLPQPFRYALPAVLMALTAATASAQTQITPDKNKFTPAEDVEIGREAAQEVRRELPMLDDGRVESYVEEVGRRLVRAIPPKFEHPEFRYTFEVVNQREINAFALPGGPMFLHRGMMEAAKSEGEVAGVMAHEIAHVALRHGTAQATKAQGFQIGAVAGQILGAIVGGTAGSIIAQGSQFGLGAYFLKYGREYEREADLLGAQIMARAGYDPRRMADMFRTIEQESKGGGGPEWLSSHPNPGNRYDAIQREAAQLRIEGSAPSDAQFRTIQSRLSEMPPAYTAEQIARAKQNGQRLPSSGGPRDDRPTRTAGGRVDPPASRYQQVTVGNFLRMQVPQNWARAGGGSNSVTYAPDGATYQTERGASGFTHGLQVGVISGEAHSHREATDELVNSLREGNPQLSRQGGYVRETIGGRAALTASLRNMSEVTGRAESVLLSTVPLRDGGLLYLIAVAPVDELNAYDATFRRIKQSVQLNDRASR